jgi:hypothetical protein
MHGCSWPETKSWEDNLVKLDDLAVPLIPRSTINCLDLGVMFYGRHLISILKLWCLFAVPVCLLVYAGSRAWEWNILQTLLIVHFATAPFGCVLGARTIRASFGEPFERYPQSSREFRQLLVLSLKTLFMRLVTLVGLCLIVIPGWWIGVRSSFMVEKACLSELQGRRKDRRNSELIGQELGQLIQRSFGILLMLAAVFAALFATIDFVASQVLGVDFLWGRVSAAGSTSLEFGQQLEMAWELLLHDPAVLAVIAALLLLIYPIARFAWFFSYVDLRVRGDFWDLELRFQKEVDYLQETAL